MATYLNLDNLADNQRSMPWTIAVVAQMPSVNILLDPTVSGYSSPYTYTSAAGDNNRKLIKSGPCLLGALMIANNTSSIKVINIYDIGVVPSSSSVPILTVPVPPNSMLTFPLNSGLRFSQGIGFSIMTNAGLLSFLGTALTGILAGDVTINLIYTF